MPAVKLFTRSAAKNTRRDSSMALAFCLSGLTFIAPVLPATAQHGQTKRTDPNTYYRAPHSMAGKMIVLPIGTTFEGRINQNISSTRSHAGESFAVVLSAPVLSNGIDVIIPAGSQVIGEVVEAIPSHAQPHKKRMPKPRGKLRIQITQLRTPDGTSYPLVANLVGEQETGRNGHGGLQTPLGSSVGYVGTAESFEAVAPGSSRYGKQYGQSRSPEKDYVHKRQFLSDEIYGMGDERGQGGDRRIRSLVLRKNDLYIDSGSPLTVRLSAPLRLAVSPMAPGAPVGSVDESTGGDDRLPPPSSRSAGADIPPLGGAPGGPSDMPEASQPSAAPPQSAPQGAQQPVPTTRPSTDF
jgi:hypothetical protein